MKIFQITISYFVLLALAASCNQKSGHEGHHAGDAVENSGNQALYDEVMKVHDEVMPKMNDIYHKKDSLRKQLEKAPELVAEERKAIENKIAKLDSASESMMEWMRQFNPIPDSAGVEKAREYLENEMERVKKVKEDILEALESANSGI